MMSGEMTVLRLHGAGDLRLSSEPVPQSGRGEVMLRVTAVGICGSDLHWLSEAGIGDALVTQPLVLGHEFVGVVETPQSSLYRKRVAVDPAIPCQECEFCLRGDPNLCANLHFAGHGTDDGALREFITWPERCLHPLPDSISDEEGVMLEPLGVALHAIDLGKLSSGISVGVFGCGPIGLLVVQLARLLGAEEIIVTDRLEHRLEAARSLGATAAFLVTDEVPEQAIWEMTDQRGVEVAFEVAGENHAVETAIAAARSGGRVVLVGIPAQDWTAFTASTARRKGLTIKLSRRMKFTYPRAIRMVDNGLIEVRSLVTYRYPLAEFEHAFQVAIQREGLKVVILP